MICSLHRRWAAPLGAAHLAFHPNGCGSAALKAMTGDDDEASDPPIQAASTGGGRRCAHRPAFHATTDGGFTLIELLVVMIIIGILAAIAIPVFLNQRQKASDTSTKADVRNMGKEIATYFVDGAGPLTLDFTASPGAVLLTRLAVDTTPRSTSPTAPPQPARVAPRTSTTPTAGASP